MRAYIVTGLGYGDEGKGAMVDHLCRTEGVDTVVRFQGGAQAGHNVRRPPRTSPGGGAAITVRHEFHQWGAGSLVPGVRTHLAGTHLVDPEHLFYEADQLGGHTGYPGEKRWREITIDRRASIVTPFHRAANRTRERVRGDARHGSTGMGIWEAQLDRNAGLDLTLGMVREMSDRELRRWLFALQERKRGELAEQIAFMGQFHPVVMDLFNRETVELFASTVRILSEIAGLTDGLPKDIEVAVFEGAQGALLSQEWGWDPYTTGSTSTDVNARAALWAGGRDASRDEVTHIGCLRAYATRHGAGPFVTEDLSVNFPEPDNRLGQWQGGWRQGQTDLVAARYGAAVQAKLDGIAVSHMDTIGPIDDWQVATGYLDGNVTYDLSNPVQLPRTKKDQERLTTLMQNAKPVLTEVSGWAVPGLLSHACGVPLMYVATGPVSEDREKVGVPA